MITDPSGPFKKCLDANVALTDLKEDCIFDTCAANAGEKKEELAAVC